MISCENDMGTFLFCLCLPYFSRLEGRLLPQTATGSLIIFCGINFASTGSATAAFTRSALVIIIFFCFSVARSEQRDARDVRAGDGRVELPDRRDSAHQPHGSQ